MKYYQKVALTLVAVTVGGMTLFAGCPNMQGNMQKNMGYPSVYQKHFMQKKHIAQHKKDRIFKIIRQLNLTEEQKEILWKENHKMREVIHNKRNAMRKEGGFKQFVTVEKFDKHGFIALEKRHANSRIQMRADRVEKLYNILTVDQKKELVELLKCRRGAQGQKGLRGSQGNKGSKGPQGNKL